MNASAQLALSDCVQLSYSPTVATAPHRPRSDLRSAIPPERSNHHSTWILDYSIQPVNR